MIKISDELQILNMNLFLIGLLISILHTIVNDQIYFKIIYFLFDYEYLHE
jgi:hypothetical protein